MSTYETDIARDLLERFPTLSEFEALKVACEMRRNSILKLAFGVRDHSDDPTNLEQIAMSLGEIASSM